MEKYYIAYYLNKDGHKTRGDWKLNEDELEEEKKRYEKVPHLQMRQIQTACIDRNEVEKMAKEHDMTIGEILSCL
jgi:hypothetical protein